MLSSANFLDTGHATLIGPGSTGAIQPFPCILPRQSHGQLPASHSSLAPTSQKLGGARDRISSQKVGAQNKNSTGGKSYKIPHNTPLFPGSQGNTSCWFFFLGSTSDSHDTFYQLSSFELGSFNLNPLMSFYVRMFIHLPPSFQKHPLVFNALFLGLALQLSKLQPKHG